ncbi:cell division protein FtsL [Aliamphritea ceti]|uniref:cell division protein FtsL n=1 Tax=Aliamphritea ceti TaxID=1524258 RepID=UPI0021C272CE|nr:cell division protein FtsL [Aliamphritea ceti]
MKVSWPAWLQFGTAALSDEENDSVVAERPAVMLKASDLYVKSVVLLVLVSCIVISALMVIFTAYQYRLNFNHQQQLVQQWDELQVEWGQLLLEQGALAANSRVENLATKKLSMQIPARIEVIRDER